MRMPTSSAVEAEGDGHMEVGPNQGRQNAKGAGRDGEEGGGQGEQGRGLPWGPYLRGWGRHGGRQTNLCSMMSDGGTYIAHQRRGHVL